VRRIALLWVLVAAASAAEVPEVTPRVTDVTVFKDGHALVMAKGAVELKDGWCRTREVPVPVLGTFWAFVAEEDARVDFLRAGLVDAKETKPCLSLDEIIQANVGKRAILVEQPKDAPPVPHEGVLRGILEHETEREAEATRTIPGSYDRWRGNTPAEHIRETRLDEVRALSSFVMLETKEGMELIQRANLRSISLLSLPPVTTRTETREVREIALHVVSKGKPLSGKHEVGMVYLQKGVRWIPNYHIELLEGGKAKLALQGTLINDLADLDNVNLGLVVGVPSFIMKDNISPVALREAGLSLSSYFLPPAPRGGGGRQFDYLSNAMMSQVAMPSAPRQEGAVGGGPDIPSEGQQEDLFLYRKTGISLKKGERAVVHLMEITVPYEDVYVWDIPAVPPMEMWRHVGSSEQQQLARSLTGAKAMHKIRLTNTGSTPWTTGPAAIFRDRTPLGQQLLTFTSVKNQVDVAITIATDLNTNKEEAEVERKHNALTVSGTSYSKITMHGKVTLTNFKDRPVRIVVKRQIIGAVAKASDDGKIRRANSTEDAILDLQGYPWYWWNWPWWWLGLNPLSQVTWETSLEKGKSVTFDYDYSYYHHP